MNNEIKQALGQFESSTIEKVDIDLLHKKITLHLLLFDNGKSEKHEVVFRGVSAFYFVADEHGTAWDENDKDSYLELSDVGYYKPPKDHITCMHGELGTVFHNSNPNFNLDIWGEVFLIQANEVSIDGLGYLAR